MIINLSNNGKGGTLTLSSYDKVVVIDHKPESKLLVLELHSGDRIDFNYEELEKKFENNTFNKDRMFSIK